MIWSSTDPPPYNPQEQSSQLFLLLEVPVCPSAIPCTVWPRSQGPLKRPSDPSGKGPVTAEDVGNRRAQADGRGGGGF